MPNQNPNIPDRIILKFAHMVKPNYDFIIEENNGDKFLVLVVDCPKMDKNSGEFDEDYYKGLVKERPQDTQIWISDSKWPILNVTKDIEKFFNIKLNLYFLASVTTDSVASSGCVLSQSFLGVVPIDFTSTESSSKRYAFFLRQALAAP